MIVIMKKIVAAICGFLPLLLSAEEFAKGVVFEDLNGNEVRDVGEKGISGIGVSDGSNIVETDAKGHWRLPVAEDVIYFVLKPSGWMVPLSKDLLPRFHYVHKSKGSPKGTKHAGVAPTGPLPKSIDFPLRRQDEPGKFSVIFFGDPQPRNQTEIDYIAHDVVEGIVGTEAKFGVTLGDIMFDDLSLFGSFNKTVALIGIPWYNVIGNHDLNFEADEDRFSDETFERVYGPAYYSFDYGKVHFLVLDNVEWSRREDGRRHYVGNFGKRQLSFIKRDLARVPERSSRRFIDAYTSQYHQGQPKPFSIDRESTLHDKPFGAHSLASPPLHRQACGLERQGASPPYRKRYGFGFLVEGSQGPSGYSAFYHARRSPQRSFRSHLRRS